MLAYLLSTFEHNAAKNAQTNNTKCRETNAQPNPDV
jgi:hypothetical protein